MKKEQLINDLLKIDASLNKTPITAWSIVYLFLYAMEMKEEGITTNDLLQRKSI